GSYYTYLGKSKSRRYVMIKLEATTNSEWRLIDADKPGAPKVFLPRTKDVLYDLDHLGNRFVIRTNIDAKNFRVVEIPQGKEGNRSAWKDLVAHRADAFVEDFAIYNGFVAASVRTSGLKKVEV